MCRASYLATKISVVTFIVILFRSPQLKMEEPVVLDTSHMNLNASFPQPSQNRSADIELPGTPTHYCEKNNSLPLSAVASTSFGGGLDKERASIGYKPEGSLVISPARHPSEGESPAKLMQTPGNDCVCK